MTQAVAFDAAYSPELMNEAARAFRDYRFRRYGPLLISACVVNALGFALLLWFGVTDTFPLAAGGFIVAIGPIWLIYEYFRRPTRHVAQMRRALPSVVRISLAADKLSVAAQGKELGIPWSRIKAVVEANGLFLLVLSPIVFTFIPRTGMPSEAYEMLHARSRPSAA